MSSNKKESFELAKPMNMVQMSWSKGMTPMQIKTVHVLTMSLKKWIMNTGYEPNPEYGDGVDAYRGIKTSFEMTLDDFSKITQTTKRALKTPVRDKEGNVVMLKGFPKLRIIEYFEEAQKITCKVNSPYIIGSFVPLPAAVYDKEKEVVRLGTSVEMAAILQDEAFSKNLSFVDMQLQLSLNSVMASHILDRISRFKGISTNYKCTVGDFIDQCGIDAKALNNRRSFISTNITRPLEQIENKSNGVWERIVTKSSKSGATVTAKKRGALQRDDEIVFLMKYNTPAAEKLENPSSEWNPPSIDDSLLQMVGHITHYISITDDSEPTLPDGYLMKMMSLAQDPKQLQKTDMQLIQITQLFLTASAKGTGS